MNFNAIAHWSSAKRVSFKFFILMKLTLLLLMSIFLKASAIGFAQEISISRQNAPLEKILKDIKSQTGYNLLYSPQVLKEAHPVSLTVKNRTLKEVLDLCFLNQPLTYAINNRTIVVKSKRLTSSTNEDDAAYTVTGMITDAGSGESLPGVSIVIEGTTIAVTSDASGRYSILVPSENAVLVFSFIGYVKERIKLSGQTELNVKLDAEVQQMNEVIVLGYGAQKKRDITGSISTVKAEDIMETPIMSPEQALQGRAAGVRVMQSNGAPGGAVQVQIRGVNSTGSAAVPLYVVDGIPLFDMGGEATPGAGGNGAPDKNLGSPLANINPNDIESMEILKDASATAIYGARASNGVVLITTKRGKAGENKFNFDYYNGVQTRQRKLEMINATEAMMVRNRGLLNTASDFTRNIEPEAFNPFAFGNSPTFKSTDWQNEMYRPAGIYDANLSANGGTDKFRYMVSGNYMKQDGIIISTDMNRASTRINLDVIASSKLKFSSSTALSYQNGDNIATDNPVQGTLIGALATPPWMAAYNADGTYFGPLQNTTFWNLGGNGVFQANEFYIKINRKRIINNISGEYEIVKGLKFKSNFGINLDILNQRRLQPSIPIGPQSAIIGPDRASNGQQRARRINREGLNWVADQILSYGTTINKIHQLDALIGFSAQSFTVNGISGQADGSLDPDLTIIGSNTTSSFSAQEAFSERGIVSQFARFNYSLMSRYLLTGTLRRDGSSTFGPGNRYGYFPAVGLAWRISEEPFFQTLAPVVSNLKLRGSYGITGNQEIGQFAFLARMGTSDYTFNNNGAAGQVPANFPNKDLRWEEKEATDVGLDLSLFKGRIDLTTDYYINNTNGLLFSQGIPITSGFGGITSNLGKIRNSGFEFSINTINTTGAFKWKTGFNISTLKNKVISLGENLGTGINQLFGYGLGNFGNNPINVTREGLPIATFYGLLTDGIYQTDAEALVGLPYNGVIPQAGDLRIKDTNGDGKLSIAAGEDDRVVLGSPFPKYFGGLSNDFAYKNFSLGVFASFSVGNKLFSQQRVTLEQTGAGAYGTVANLEAWSGPGTSNTVPRLTLGGQSQNNRITADRFLEDASFLRIRNINLAYNLPNKLINKFKIDRMRIYASVSNAFTFTKYSGWDPEINSSGSDALSMGIDQSGYPLARTFQLGLNLGF